VGLGGSTPVRYAAGTSLPAAKAPYAGHHFPAEVISQAVWLYFRFPLGLRMVEEMLAARGIVVSHETVRQWATLLHRSPGWVASGRVRPGRAPLILQGHPSCGSKRTPLGAITSRSRSTG
jgi:hypothetical protein